LVALHEIVDIDCILRDMLLHDTTTLHKLWWYIHCEPKNTPKCFL